MNTAPQQPWLQYKRPFVRDLAFAIACPDALRHWISPNPNTPSPNIEVHKECFWQQNYLNYENRLQELDSTKQYKVLTRYLMSRPSPYRLGFHFEGLLHFWLEDGYRLNRHPYQVLAHNIQLYREKQTTGELDFILRNHDTNEVEHWELTIKFYLGSPPYDFVNWVGINSRDNFERKMTHMQTKQFRSIWVDMDFHETVKIDKRFVILKGRFFQPENSSSHQTFVKPTWLTDSFPIHQWHVIKTPSDFAHLNMPNLRPAHYIEWFTVRPFYNANFLTAKGAMATVPQISLPPNSLYRSAQTKDKHFKHWPHVPLAFEDLDTNLYMNDSEPVVLVIDKAEDN